MTLHQTGQKVQYFCLGSLSCLLRLHFLEALDLVLNLPHCCKLQFFLDDCLMEVDFLDNILEAQIEGFPHEVGHHKRRPPGFWSRVSCAFTRNTTKVLTSSSIRKHPSHGLEKLE